MNTNFLFDRFLEKKNTKNSPSLFYFVSVSQSSLFSNVLGSRILSGFNQSSVTYGSFHHWQKKKKKRERDHFFHLLHSLSVQIENFRISSGYNGRISTNNKVEKRVGGHSISYYMFEMRFYLSRSPGSGKVWSFFFRKKPINFTPL